MDIDDLKPSWNEMTSKTQELERVQSLLVMRAKKNDLSAVPRALAWSAGFEIGFFLLLAYLAVELLSRDMAAALAAPAGMWPLLAIVVLGLPLPILAARRLSFAAGIAPGDPVAEVHRKLIRLDQMMARSTQAMMGVWLVLWAALPAFILQLAAGYNAVFAIRTEWVAANAAFGLAVACAAVMTARRLGPDHPLMGRVNQAFSSQAIQRARRQMAELADFER